MKKLITTLTALAVLLVALTACFAPENVDDTGHRLTGKYQWSLGSYVGASTYTFDGDRVTNEYYTDEKQVIEYTYVIAVEGGQQVIRLTDLSNGKTATYEFGYGSDYVEISGQRYDLVEE